MNPMSESNAIRDEHLDYWYQDPRVWVLVVAAVMFFSTLFSELSEKKTRRVVSVPATFLSSPTVSKDTPAAL